MTTAKTFFKQLECAQDEITKSQHSASTSDIREKHLKIAIQCLKVALEIIK